MASGTIRGITISFNAETTKLDRALKDINSKTRDLDKELKAVDKALKFNPDSVELWRQKQQLLTEKVQETKNKLDVLKQAQAKLDASGVEKNSAEYRELQREIITTESKCKSFEKQLREVGNVNLKATAEQIKGIGDSFTNAGNALMPVSKAGAAVAGSLFATAVNSGLAADDLNTLAKTTGISTEQLQKYATAADLVDVSVETIAKSQQKLKKNMSEASKGSKTQTAAFEKLGVAIQKADGTLRDSDDVFQDVIAALGQLEEGTERDALAMDIFGKSATELNPLIADGGKTYQQVAELYEKYNLQPISQETLDKANQFNDTLDTLKILGSNALQTLGAKAAEALLPVMDKIVEIGGKISEWIANLDPETVALIGTIAGVIAVVAPLLILIGKVATGISAIINVVNSLGAVFSFFTSPVGLVIAAIAALIAIGVALYKNWDTIKEKLEAFKQKILDTWENIKKKTSEAWEDIKEKITKPFKDAKAFIEETVEKIKGWFPINIKELLSKIKLPHFSLTGSFSLVPPSIPKLSVDWYDKGGIFDSPSIIGVGEKRPEFVGALDDLRKIVREETGGINPVFNIYQQPGQSSRALAEEIEQKLAELLRTRETAHGVI